MFYSSSIRKFAMKSPVPIKWVRPEKISCIKPVKSGDLQPLKVVDGSKQIPLEFMSSEELQTADSTVKRLFTLEFFPYKKTVEYLRSSYIDEVKRHELDKSSPEVRVAKMTADIRDMQQFMESNPTDKRTKVRLKETIDKRKKLLNQLRKMDYKCFEWILEKMELIYKPEPPIDIYRRVERKRSLRMLTKQYCENIVESRLSEYKKHLESQQEEFLEKKINTLKFIVKEELECGVTPTVTQEDIEKVENQLQVLRSQKKKIEPILET